MVVGIHALANHLAQRVERVGHRAAEDARVQVGIGTCNFNLPVGQAAQARRDGWHIGSNHTGIGNQDNIGFHEVLVHHNPFGQAT